MRVKTGWIEGFDQPDRSMNPLPNFTVLGFASLPGYARLHGIAMSKALDLDLKKLKARAFDRAEWAGEALQRYHAVIGKLGDAVVQPLRGLYQWMFVPTTLWPFNVQDVLEDCLVTLEKREKLNSRHRLLIDLLPEPPDEAVCAAVASHELHVQKGTYENVVKTQAKYAQNELSIKTDPQLRRQWARI